MEEFQCSQHASRWLLITLGNGALSGVQCWSLLLADKALSNSISQVSLAKEKSIPATTIVFMSPLS